MYMLLDKSFDNSNVKKLQKLFIF